MSLLTVKNLQIKFENSKSLAIDNISFNLDVAKITALIGQSGSGKSVASLAILQLLRGAKISGEVNFNLRNLLEVDDAEITKIRGKEIGIIFQDPSSALNPLHKIGAQIAEAIKIHNPKISKKYLRERVLELLDLVDLKNFAPRLQNYPHQISGGQKQRVMIAIKMEKLWRKAAEKKFLAMQNMNILKNFYTPQSQNIQACNMFLKK